MAEQTPTTTIQDEPRRNLIGQRFGKLFVVELLGKHGATWRWRCVCDCGAQKLATTVNLLQGSPNSCGCQFTRKIHGMASRVTGEHPLYKAWLKMRERCTNPKQHAFHRYGGRGIKVCDRWMYDFATFAADMGPKPTPQHSLDRIDGDGDYEPGNCRWATATEQCRNQISNRLVTFIGREMTLAEAVELSGLNYHAVKARISRLGWTAERALTTPISPTCRK
jgi:hypothetical protein